MLQRSLRLDPAVLMADRHRFLHLQAIHRCGRVRSAFAALCRIKSRTRGVSPNVAHSLARTLRAVLGIIEQQGSRDGRTNASAARGHLESQNPRSYDRPSTLKRASAAACPAPTMFRTEPRGSDIWEKPWDIAVADDEDRRGLS
jgi:hypothetical protein